jgi:hypothetical protein
MLTGIPSIRESDVNHHHASISEIIRRFNSVPSDWECLLNLSLIGYLVTNSHTVIRTRAPHSVPRRTRPRRNIFHKLVHGTESAMR